MSYLEFARGLNRRERVKLPQWAHIESLETRVLMAGTDVIKTGIYASTAHSFELTSVTPPPTSGDGQNIIDLAATAASVTIAGRVYAPTGFTALPGTHDELFVRAIRGTTGIGSNAPLNTQILAGPAAGSQTGNVGHTLIVDGTRRYLDFSLSIPASSGLTQFTYQIERLTLDDKTGDVTEDVRITVSSVDSKNVPNGTLTGAIAINFVPVAQNKTELPIVNGSNFELIAANYGTDADGDSLSFSGTPTVQAPGSGTIQTIDGKLFFVPSEAFVGTAKIDYRITDGRKASAEATISLEYKNVPPQLVSKNLQLASDVAGGVITDNDLNVTDRESAPGDITLKLKSLPKFGTLTLRGAPLAVDTPFSQADVNAGVLQYIRDPSQLAETRDSFEFSYSDEENPTVSDIFSIVVGKGIRLPSISDIVARNPQGGITPVSQNRPAFEVSNAPAGALIRVKTTIAGQVVEIARIALGDAETAGTALYSATNVLPDGAYVFFATAEIGGEESDNGPNFPASGPIVIDSTAFTSATFDRIETDTGNLGDEVTSDDTPIVVVNVVGTTLGERVYFTLNSDDPALQPILLDFVAAGSPFQLALPKLASKSRNFTIIVRDEAGNKVEPDTKFSMVVDTTKPEISNIHLLADDVDSRSNLPTQVSKSLSPRVVFDLTDQAFSGVGNVISIAIHDGLGGPRKVGTTVVRPIQAADNQNFTTSIQLTVPNLSPGSHTLYVLATDLAGSGVVGEFKVFINDPNVPDSSAAAGTPVYATVLNLSELFGWDGKKVTVAGELEYPWSMAFDRTTQTAWVLLRGGDEVTNDSANSVGGNRVIQIDPATNSYRLYDLQGLENPLVNPGLSPEVRAALFDANRLDAGGPHGAAFDFESHLTPRIWFTQMIGGLVSYIDIETNKLVVYDINAALGGLTPHLDAGVHADAHVHAVAVDSRGTVWITDETHSRILEIANDGVGDLDSTNAILRVHEIPVGLRMSAQEYANSLDTGDFIEGPHGIDVVVSDRTNQPVVYFTLLGKGSVVRLIPKATGDEWTNYDPKLASSGLPLFVTIDTNETPGNPDDDSVYFGDPANQGATIGGGTYVGKVVPSTGEITTWKIPIMAGGDRSAQPNQTFVDREGNLFYIDRAFGFGRLDRNVASQSATLLDSYTPPGLSPVFTTPAPAAKPLVPTILSVPNPATRVLPTSQIDVRSVPVEDRSQYAGIDQYDLLAGGVNNSRGDGPFRGTMNAANVLYGSLTQSDRFVTAVFAETSRRQVAVVAGPGQARTTFAVGRNGHVTVSERDFDDLKDSQRDLTATIPGAALIDGDVSAVADQSGLIYLFGRDRATGGLVILTYNPATKVGTSRVVARPSGDVFTSTPSAFFDPIRGAATAITTASGQLLLYYAGAPEVAYNVTAPAGGNKARMYGVVGVGVVNDRVYFYGGNQTGKLLELSYPVAGGPQAVKPTDFTEVKYAQEPGKKTADPVILQNIEVLIDGTVRHVFATDGNSRLIHVQAGAGGKVKAENITEAIFGGVGPELLSDVYLNALRDNGKIRGYSNYQMRFAGRVYTDVAPVIDPVTGDIYVYGTNGRDLIQFWGQKSSDNKSYTWSVVNLTNNISGALDGTPANKVFGAPAAYLSDDGTRHVLQINEDGDLIEYYQLVAGAVFSTQNVTLSQFRPTISNPGDSINTTVNHPRRIGPKATPLTGNPASRVSGTIQSSTDRHVFRFRAESTGRVKMDLHLVAPDSRLALRVFNRKGKRIKVRRNLTFLARAGRSYFVVVKGTPSRGGAPGRPGTVGSGAFDLSVWPLG